LAGQKLQSKTLVRSARDRLIVALDVPTLDEAQSLAEKLSEHVGVFKVGLELYARHGTSLFAALKQFERPIFFDCKFLDIPNTVARASQQLVGHDILMFNVHATGGAAMLKATAEAVHTDAVKKKVVPPQILAVTILTSLGDAALRDELGWNIRVEQAVEKLAVLSRDCGIDGVVASALEAARIRQVCGENFLIVTPGVRPEWAASDDQVRAVTPAQAMANGADYIVVGRPITRHENPADAARKIVDEVAQQV
jgi:orotidine-5'-phosphate decarboxylase